MITRLHLVCRHLTRTRFRPILGTSGHWGAQSDENALEGASPTVRPLLIFQDPSSLQGRQWVLETGPPQIHDVVCTLLPPSTGFPVEIAVIRASAGTDPPGKTDDATEAGIAFVAAGISAAAKTWLWRVRASTINIVSARRAGEGWPLSLLLGFLERVTTQVHVTVRGDRFPQLLRARLQDLATNPLETFALELTRWYLEGDGA